MNNDDYKSRMEKIREIRKRMDAARKLMNARNRVDLDRLGRLSAQIKALRLGKRFK